MKYSLDDNAYEIEKAHITDAGYDLRAREIVVLEPNSITLVDTGVHVEIPLGCVGIVKSRSSMLVKGIVVDGTIDCGYTGAIRVIMNNTSNDYHIYEKGEKIAQLVVLQLNSEGLMKVDKLSETERGEKGFGSSGK